MTIKLCGSLDLQLSPSLRIAIILLEFLFIFYYTAVVFQLLDVWKITNRKITWKAIIPFYYFIKR